MNKFGLIQGAVVLLMLSVISNADVVNPPDHDSVAAASGAIIKDGSVLWTGTDDHNGNIITNVSVMAYTPISAPAYSEGLTFYDTDDKTLTYYNEEADVKQNIGRELWERVRNVSGITITNGKVCYVSGAQGNIPTVELADADVHLHSECIVGVANHDIENNSIGYVTISGDVNEVDTSAFLNGALVYLSQTPGELTTNAPVPPAHAVVVGKIHNAHVSQGIIGVRIGEALDVSRLVVEDDNWLGLGVAGGRIEWDDQATDEVNILDALVGIGTNAPTYRLHIVDAVNTLFSLQGITDPTMQLEGYNETAGTGPTLSFVRSHTNVFTAQTTEDGDQIGEVAFCGHGSSDLQVVAAKITVEQSGAALPLLIPSDMIFTVSTSSEMMRLAGSAGDVIISADVGIETNSPLATLHVNGDLRTEENVLVLANQIMMNAVTDPDELVFKFRKTTEPTNGVSVGMLLWSGDGDFASINVVGIDTDGEGADMVFSTADTGGSGEFERMRITGAGLVGIATNTPTSPLDVVGAIRSQAENTPTKPTGGRGVEMWADNNTTFPGLSSTGYAAVVGYDRDLNTRMDLVFDASGYAFSVDGIGDKLVILNSGNVGLDDNVPATRLDISDGALAMEVMTAPGTPATSNVYTYVDAADGYLKAKNDAGSVQILANWIGGSVSDVPVAVTNASYSITATDGFLLVNSPAGGTNIVLTTAETFAGRDITIKDAVGASAITNITIVTQGSELIDGASSYLLNAAWEGISLRSDGTDWFAY